ncbi:myocyte-specific enhancer factor 2 isoform X3 [Nasonia vitripennis]|uniref:MADS-box domain-containing protein n=1 Tax=Nasonia vitripennis TaxID=7425 RepID=A0A7M7QTC3_NASVI|nr:myocyte-specific enhancer factor 2 isoform X3 [Nasonia vitripennis]XP_032454476.1 myocyte-specific enhancer factor 2 isoform X3 [Nasonia vitripennis]XP_032454477.1 myocyte-specific enhancer factor 2 isoform X3 [Nasonia vitripennis]
MGRKKIQISRITDERNRQVTFNKRKFGVMKKAYELSVLCDCEIALIIFSSSNKLYQYASTDMDKVLLKYTEYNEPHESLTNKNIIEKEHKGAMSPESPEPDQQEYNSLTPRTEAKYAKIDEDFQMLIRNQHNGSRGMGQSNYTLPVTVPVNNYGENMLGSSPQMAHTSISPRPSSSETDSVYPPGGMLEMSNGYPPSASPLGGSPSPGPSPSLGVSKGNPSRHSPQPPPPPHPHRGALRVVIPTPLGQSLAEEPSYDSGHAQSSLNTPVVALQTPSVPPSYTSFGPTDYSTDLSSLAWSHQRYVDDLSMYSAATMSSISSLPHLAVSSSTPPPSTSPIPVKIKSEPISPPRDPHAGSGGSNGSISGPSNSSSLHHPGHTSLNVGGPSSSSGGPQPPPPHHVSQQQQHGGPQTLNLVSVSRPGSNPPPSHSGSITPTNLPSPGPQGGGGGGNGGVVVGDMRTSHGPGASGGSGSDYENGPLHKRSRITEGWAT